MTLVERTRRLVATDQTRVLHYLPAALLVLDLAAVSLAGTLALWGRESLDFFAPTGGIGESVNAIAYLALPAWLAAIAVVGGYDRKVLGWGPDEFKRVLVATFLTAGTIGIFCYLAKYPLSRGFFLLALLFGMAMLITGRFVMRRLIYALRRRGHLQLRVLVAGTPERIDEVSRLLAPSTWMGYSVIGAAVTHPEPIKDSTRFGVPILGSTSELVQVAQHHQADVIFLTGGVMQTGEHLKELVWELEAHRTSVVIAPSVSDISQKRIRIRPAGGVPFIHVDHPRSADASRIGKRTFDVIGSVAAMAALSPLFLIAATQIWLHDRGPLLFKHRRIGREGRVFECLKFRTMVLDAEDRLAAMQAQSGQAALLFKLKDDPRITRPGGWLRRFSIDELPQLWNVLRGDMSLVGPRPQVQSEVDLYHGGMARRLLVRPGMTGLWQVSGRSDLSQEEAMRLDIYYVDNWSMVQDLIILARTIRAVISSRGAY